MATGKKPAKTADKLLGTKRTSASVKRVAAPRLNSQTTGPTGSLQREFELKPIASRDLASILM